VFNKDILNVVQTTDLDHERDHRDEEDNVRCDKSLM